MIGLVSIIIALYLVHDTASFPSTRQFHSSTRKSLTVNQLPELINPSYNLAIGSASLGALGNFISKSPGVRGPIGKIVGGASVGLLLFGGFLAFQTTTLRFQFSSTHFSLVKADSGKLGDNIVVGGENSWRYDTFVNWDFLPNEDFPILVYFKETQTSKEKWVEAPIVVDNIPGQAHFFPAIANVQELKDNFIRYGCKKVDSSASPVQLKATSKLIL
eukprot:gene29974-39150_t